MNRKPSSFKSPASKSSGWFYHIFVIFTNSHNIAPSNRKVSGRNSGSNGSFIPFMERVKDIRKAPSDEAVEVAVDKFVTLVEQVILLLGQASLSLSYTRRHNIHILKMIMKDPGKAKAMLKENKNILRESETHLFGKRF